jgi:hypothetical protein
MDLLPEGEGRVEVVGTPLFADVDGCAASEHQAVGRHLRNDGTALAHGHKTVAGHMSDGHGMQIPLREDLAYALLATGLRDDKHALLRFAEHDFVGAHALLAHGHEIEIDVHADATLGRHFAARAGDACGAHVLHADEQIFTDDLERGLEQQLLGEGIADLHGRTAGF